MHTLWQYSTDEGAEIYGAAFQSIHYFLELHHFNAAWRDADHFHEVGPCSAPPCPSLALPNLLTSFYSLDYNSYSFIYL